jgi:hypothetical protein
MECRFPPHLSGYVAQISPGKTLSGAGQRSLPFAGLLII